MAPLHMFHIPAPVKLKDLRFKRGASALFQLSAPLFAWPNMSTSKNTHFPQTDFFFKKPSAGVCSISMCTNEEVNRSNTESLSIRGRCQQMDG